MDSLEKMFHRSGSSATKASAEVEKVGKAAADAEKKAAKAGGSVKELGEFLEDLSTHTRTASIALNAMGLKTEAAMVKVEGLTQLVKGMSGAVPALLGFGAALGAAGAAFEFIKDSADEASHWQKSIALLGQTVKNQGGNWREARDSVLEFAEAQEKTTTFSRDEAVDAIERLTSTGMALSDAMKVTRVAEDAAAATGRSLTDVNFALSEAMHGRTQALTQLGIGTRASIREGMSFKDVLSAIEKNMGGSAAAAADTYDGKVKQLHNTWETLEENVGTVLLPVLTKLMQTIINGIELVEHWGTTWKDLGAAFGDIMANMVTVAERAVIGIAKALTGPIRAMWDAMHGNVGAARSDLADMLNLNLAVDVTRAMMQGGFRDIGKYFQNVLGSPSNAADISSISSGLANTMVGGRGGGRGAWRGGSTKVGTAHGDTFTVYIPPDAYNNIVALDDQIDKTMKSTMQTANRIINGDIDAIAKNWEAAAKAYEQAIKNYEKLTQEGQKWADKTAGFFEQIFEGGKHHVNVFRDFFKSFLKDIEQSLLKSALFSLFMGAHGAGGGLNFGSLFMHNMQGGAGSNPLLGFLGSMSSMGGGGRGGSGVTDGTGGIIGGLVGTSSATQLASSLPTDSLMSMLFGVGAPGVPGGASSGGGGGGGSGVIGIATAGAGGLAGLGGVGGIAQGIGSINGLLGNLSVGGQKGIGAIGALLGKPIGSIGGTALGTIGSTLLGGLGGYLVGGVLNPFNRNTGVSGITGALGGAAGAAFGPALAAALGIGAGPAGIGLAIIGSLVGSLFGGPKPTQQTMPDIVDTSNYGQIIANLAGAGTSAYGASLDPTNRNYSTVPGGLFTANGQQFSSNIASITGNMSGVSWVEEMLSKYANADGSPGPNTPSWLLPLWSQLVPAFGISATGSGQLAIGANGSGKGWNEGVINAPFASGQMPYTQYGSLLSDLLNNYMTQGNVSWSPYTPPNLAQTPGVGGPGAYIGSPFVPSYVVGTPGSTPTINNGAGLPGLNIGSGGAVGLVSGTGATAPVNVNVTVNVGGNVVAERDLAQSITDSIVKNMIAAPGTRSMTLGGLGL